jgi:hypothetical protein
MAMINEYHLRTISDATGIECYKYRSYDPDGPAPAAPPAGAMVDVTKVIKLDPVTSEVTDVEEL